MVFSLAELDVRAGRDGECIPLAIGIDNGFHLVTVIRLEGYDTNKHRLLGLSVFSGVMNEIGPATHFSLRKVLANLSG
jgi:hypothetical protein